MSSNLPISFPYDGKSAQKTAKAGVLTCNDTISEDAYHVMTRQTANDVVTHTTSMYSLDEDTSRLIESARSETAVGTNGSAKVTTSLLQTVNGIRTMNDVLSAAPDQVAISAYDTNGNNSTARFTMDGLVWDSQTSSVYIGGLTFRIRYAEADATNNNIASLNIEARHPVTGGYVIKQSISND